MSRRGGVVGAKRTVSSSAASGIWDLYTHQQERGQNNWTGVPFAADYLVLGGGGGGGPRHSQAIPYVSDGSGGGGSGGLRSTVTATGGTGSLETALSLFAGTSYQVVVGAGRGGNANGANSTFDSITALGGGDRGGSLSSPAGSVTVIACSGWTRCTLCKQSMSFIAK